VSLEAGILVRDLLGDAVGRRHGTEIALAGVQFPSTAEVGFGLGLDKSQSQSQKRQEKTLVACLVVMVRMKTLLLEMVAGYWPEMQAPVRSLTMQKVSPVYALPGERDANPGRENNDYRLVTPHCRPRLDCIAGLHRHAVAATFGRWDAAASPH
jgi:hypothetical protein